MNSKLDEIVLVYTTLGSEMDAEKLGGKLVGEKLAGCVNIFPGMISIYEWEGKTGKDAEVAMIIKTRAGKLDALMKRAEELHPYETPALIALPVLQVNEDYASWLIGKTQV